MMPPIQKHIVGNRGQTCRRIFCRRTLDIFYHKYTVNFQIKMYVRKTLKKEGRAEGRIEIPKSKVYKHPI